MPPKVTFASRLRFWLKKRGMSQRELAKRVAVDAAAVHRWVYGTTHPTYSHLEGVAKALGVPLVRLLGGKLSDEPEARC